MHETNTTGRLSYGIPPPAFRLPDATHVGAVHVEVVNLQRSLSYYEQVLGLRAHNVTDISAVLGAHHDDRPLVTLHARRGVTRARRGSFGLYHFAILLPDRSALGRFARHLLSSGERVGMADHLVSHCTCGPGWTRNRSLRRPPA
jgi:catechol 2,3-dioxygenase